jgi:hypothetical protein
MFFLLSQLQCAWIAIPTVPFRYNASLFFVPASRQSRQSGQSTASLMDETIDSASSDHTLHTRLGRLLAIYCSAEYRPTPFSRIIVL